MSSKSVFFILIIIVLTLFSFHAVAGAEPDALEQLIKIFEGKSLLSPQEVTKLRKILAKDQERLQKIERDIAQREKSLNEKERQLEAREAAVEKLEQSESAKRTSQTPSNATGKRPETVEDTHSGIALDVSYRDGLYFHDTKDDLFSLRIGGLLQTDYRYFSYHDENPQKNKFDLRRVRLYLAGRLYKYFSYKFEYEFQGASSREILDAYVDTQLSPFFSLRIGQFKEPFGLEHSTKDKNLVFAERSFGYYLTPSRDLGIMAHASFWKDRIYYGLGLFNGDGLDDSVGGDVDDPEWTGRLVLAPWKNRGYPFFDNLQIGGSLGYANIDRNNVNLSVRTTGLTEFFDVASSAKFNVIRNAGDRLRYGLELGWAYGPLALWAEYIDVKYKDIETSSDIFDFEIKNYYVALLWMISGEKATFRHGIFQPIKPAKSVWEGGWGAFGLALRYDYFEADSSVYDDLINMGDSVRKAKAYTISFNWFIDSSVRFILDATRTDFSDPLQIDRDPLTGESIFSDREDVITARFQFAY